MGNITPTLDAAMRIDGAIAVALVDYDSGMLLGHAGSGNLDIELAAAGNTDVVRAKMRTLQSLGLGDGIEDFLMTLSTQLHLIRMLQSEQGKGLFLYLALHRAQANLAMARRQLLNLEHDLVI
ncbi:hypothetical protein [Cellulomonas triticagri]|uniref:Roadblock/LC7 domain-containing protein n=1 Tax=Cellulomonas triticagri TaxID=2483352 RepID=A0A3M2IQ31_9CELL|nr:hypothetical protein [Cellulomonas triticagri]RMI00518.1 hypothetical protein EBM89_20790 [Cellulomonas triticagri]